MLTDVFLDQKRVNVCENMVKTVPCESFGKVPPDWVQDRKMEGVEGMVYIVYIIKYLFSKFQLTNCMTYEMWGFNSEFTRLYNILYSESYQSIFQIDVYLFKINSNIALPSMSRPF